MLLYPLYHPAAALYTPRMLEVLEEDFAGIPELLGRAAARPRPSPASRRPSPTARARAGPARPLLTEQLGLRVQVETASPEETEAVAGRLARDPRCPATSSTVSGELGAARRRSSAVPAARSASTQPVTSPTFTVGHRYDGASSHLDLYRFAGVSAAEWGDLEPYFEGTIAFVEWPEAAGTRCRRRGCACGCCTSTRGTA